MEGSQNDAHSSQGKISEGEMEGGPPFSPEKKAEQKDQLSTVLLSARELLVGDCHFNNYQQAAELLEQALLKVQEATSKIVEAEVCGELANVFLQFL